MVLGLFLNLKASPSHSSCSLEGIFNSNKVQRDTHEKCKVLLLRKSLYNSDRVQKTVLEDRGIFSVAWQYKATEICPQLSRSSPGGCRFSEGAG